MDPVALSVVIPVFDEEASLPELFRRLYAVLDALGRRYEVLFIDDGSRDRSAELLAAQFEARPDTTRIIFLAKNFGQHRAILAGFAHSLGQKLVTMDADLQNPPEEIGVLLAKLDEGYDYVGSVRRSREDSWWRCWASRWINRLREWTTQIRMSDHGCMLRAYDRRLVNAINECREVNTFIPALAHLFSKRPTEVIIRHEARAAGASKYPFYSLVRLNYDLMTGFSVFPLQCFSIAGITVSLFSGLFFIYLLARRLTLGPEVEGVFTLFAIVFFLIGVLLFGIGLMGEYIARIYQEVQRRPRYLIERILEKIDQPS